MTQTLLRFTAIGQDWILYALGILSLLSVAVMIERLLYFSLRGVRSVDTLAEKLLEGDLTYVRDAIKSTRGMEGEVLRAALDEVPKGADAVAEVIASGIARQRMHYERWLAYLGTLGNNAPFVGLLGTVLGIIRAFQDLATATPGQVSRGPQTVMAGISAALVATAVGLFVALPAVVAFNGFQRWLKTITGKTNMLGHALVAYLRSNEV
jgi:biopolymer transport protein ExbB